jgi:hypothetical protein
MFENREIIFWIAFILFALVFLTFLWYVIAQMQKAIKNSLKIKRDITGNNGKSSEKRISEFTRKFKDIQIPEDILRDYEGRVSNEKSES